eukprot:6163891-Ditylum_brightwellii.AAC.1
MLCGYDDVDLDDIFIVSLKKEMDRIEEKKHSRYKKFFLNGGITDASHPVPLETTIGVKG